MSKGIFDPTRRFGSITGIHDAFPGARFEQDGYLFSIHHKLLNPDHTGPTAKTEVQEADAELAGELRKKLTKLTAELGDLTGKVKDSTATKGEKARHTKALKEYKNVQAQLEGLTAAE